ncbi:MAG: carbon-nitrogen hydrolase family protein [Anaerolineae bacterium]|nr:carbon-nitrogen hydrolase family protein [Anaerolineae bacterium]
MPREDTLRVGICQFAVSNDVRANGAQIREQMWQVKQAGADIAHFPECALTGYPGYKGYAWQGFDWDAIKEETAAIMALSKEHEIWVALPSAHRLSVNRLPHNCVYVINSQGEIADRYDKRFCTLGETPFYTPGNHPVVFKVRNVTCGIIICYEKWFPELFRDYKRRGVQVILDSIHSQERDFSLRTDKNCLDDAERALWIAHARLNHLWISVSNHCRPDQDNTSFLVDPDGRLQKLPFRETHVAVFEIDTSKALWDPSGPFRDLALAGAMGNGQKFDDPRSIDRTSL